MIEKIKKWFETQKKDKLFAIGIIIMLLILSPFVTYLKDLYMERIFEEGSKKERVIQFGNYSEKEDEEEQTGSSFASQPSGSPNKIEEIKKEIEQIHKPLNSPNPSMGED